MPVKKLFVEGNLDIALLNPIFAGSPVLTQGGSKDSLRPQARREIDMDKVRCNERGEEPDKSKVVAGYLRDRDFDFEPPNDLSKPTMDRDIDGIPFGWRWCRHEIESYLIEPSLINRATSWPKAEIEDAIRDIAKNIRYYEAARWTIGAVRSALPPHHELKTRPDDLKRKDFALPSDLSCLAVNIWAINTIDSYRAHFIGITDNNTVKEKFKYFITRFDDAFTDDVENVLVWFSGKDILAAMDEWIKTKNKRIDHPAKFVETIRDWVIANPEQTLELLPEWAGLREALRT